ncbi:hypothetical protein L3Y34_016280 [Caenorhabditis briggsae]|uniref:Uncharacterized protein n=1 Tax=Caenorhabditis briggsae TaxID=6238 RepID=A0AAE9DZQ6_CAEBR|nr:hypothetical protein L3Y34_016280 [Caenorhabditis briggsae]
MGSKDIGSKELFTQSLYAQSAPVGPKSKENMSMAPKSLPATSAPNANSSFPRSATWSSSVSQTCSTVSKRVHSTRSPNSSPTTRNTLVPAHRPPFNSKIRFSSNHGSFIIRM